MGIAYGIGLIVVVISLSWIAVWVIEKIHGDE